MTRRPLFAERGPLPADEELARVEEGTLDLLGRRQIQGAVTIRQKAHAAVAQLTAQHEYELEGEVQHELDDILARARAALS